MNDKNENLEELIVLIADAIDIDFEEIQPDARFIEDMGVDSLISLEVLVSLEREYKIKIPESDLEKLFSVNAVYDLLESKGIFNNN
jgi:acyl carrier protein